MQFPSAAYDSELLKLMSRAFDDACRDVARMEASCDAAQTMIALRIMTAVSAGERNVERLRLLALQSIDGGGIAIVPATSPKRLSIVQKTYSRE